MWGMEHSAGRACGGVVKVTHVFALMLEFKDVRGEIMYAVCILQDWKLVNTVLK